MKKIVFAVVIAIVVVLGLSGCCSYVEPVYPYRAYYSVYPYRTYYYYLPYRSYYYRQATPPPPRHHRPYRR